jgi:hypothetical protein
MDRGDDSDRFNRHLLKLIHDDGSAYFSSTLIEGNFVIRSAILSFRTRISSVDKAIELISQCLNKTKEHFEKGS